MLYFYVKKQGPDARSNFLSVGPERTGNPSKNPQKHLKKPLPPREAGGRQGGGRLGWAGLGWAGLGWAGLDGLAGVKELDFDSIA